MNKERKARMQAETLPADGTIASSGNQRSASGPRFSALGDTLAQESSGAASRRAFEAGSAPSDGSGSFAPPPSVDEYELLQPIGHGSMGQIFLARDTRLDRAVAVKFIATQPTTEARERFLIEARAIARLQHPNVVSIFRVGEIEGHPYLVSEFIDGQSLDKLSKPLPWPRALVIAVDLVRGLAAAHLQGVLHRDIKPANVMLTRSGTVKLLDFGLAKLSDSAHVETSSEAVLEDALDAAPQSQNLTAVGALMGTPAYMSPEAWQGKAATTRTDIYSLGALLYELCSGRTPSHCEDLLTLRRTALERDPAPLSSIKPDIHVGFAEVIHRCLRREPEGRYASAEELLQALEKISSALSAPTSGAMLRQELRRRWPVALLVTALLIGTPIAVLYPVLTRRDAPTAAVTANSPRRAVAVLGVNTSAGAPQLSSAAAALSELLSDELSAGEKLRRIPPDTVTRMRMELALPIDDSLSPEALARVHRYAGADLVVTGALTAAADGELTVRAGVKECPGGKEVAAASASGRIEELFDVASDLGAQLRSKLGAGELSAEQVGELRAARPSSPEAAQRFAEGQERLRRFDLVGARDILTDAVAKDPDHALGHFALAGVWSALGYDARAREATERAFRQSRHLAREPRILLEARYRELNKEWDQALGLYGSLVTFFPDSLEYGLSLANAQLSAGQLAAALVTTQRLHLLPAPAREDPRINITQAEVTIDQGDYPATLALLNESIRQGEEMKAPLLVAKARLGMAYLHGALGQHKDAIRSAAQAQEVYDAAGDHAAVAETLIVQGSAYGFLGQVDAAVDALGQALSKLLEIENNALVAIVMGNMAIALCKQGKFDLALARAEAALTWGRELDSKESIGAAEIAIGWIATLKGQLDVARKHYARSEKVFALLGDPRLIAWIDWHNGQLLAAEGLFAEAARKHEGALAMREKHDLKGFAAESRVALAELALDQGKPAAAADHARLAAQQFRSDGEPDSEALALALLGHALTELGRSEDAREAIARAVTLSRGTQNALVRVQVSRLLAELAGGERAKADVARAEAALLAARVEARSIGMVHEALLIDLALCRIEASLGHKEEAATRAAALAKEARDKGFLSIAAKAGEATPTK